MDINYIILVHKNSNQLRRLIERLHTENTFFYIHVDKNVDIDSFVEVTKELNNIYFLPSHKRENGTWGDIGIVKATINALYQIVDDGRNGYTILLSGQDYPIQSTKKIESFLSKNYGDNFIETFSIPADCWSNKGMSRINKYKFNISNRRYNFVQVSSIFESEFYTRQTFKDILRLIKYRKYSYLLPVFIKRKFPNYIKPFGGSQWWALTNEAVNKIIKFLHDYPDYLKYNQYTLLPDEIFFQSIIMHLAEKDQEIIIKDSLTYVNWTRKNCQLPVTFISSDIKELIGQMNYKFFARKFDVELDEEILNKLDDFNTNMNLIDT